MFKRNLANWDRAARVVVGLVCVYLGFIDTSIIGSSLVAILVGVFGIVNIGAATVSYCPVYGLAGLSTAGDDKKAAD